MRNLGFEDTPDYDLLRDLFTQALKNTGEVEDGEYDWMKLNNGKGWEAISKHPSHQYQGHNQAHATTTGELRHVPPAQVRQPAQGLTPGRLNAPHPPPPSPGKPMGQIRTEGRNVTGAPPNKRPSAPTGALPKPVSTPAASTQVQQQFHPSNPTLQPAVRGQSPQVANNQQQQQRNSQTEPKKSFMQKLSSVFCCGTLEF